MEQEIKMKIKIPFSKQILKDGDPELKPSEKNCEWNMLAQRWALVG